MALLDGFTDHVIDTGEVEIAYSVGPANGPDLLLLHGFSDRRDGFIGIYDAITKNHRVLTMDQRGHGFSGRTSGHYGREDYARDIRFILDNVCQGPTVVWGHSMGGGNVMEVMADPPENVKAMVLEDAALFGAKRPVRKEPSGGVDYFQVVLEMLQTGASEVDLLKSYEAKFPGHSDSYNRLRAQSLSQMDIEILRNRAQNRSRSGHDPEQVLKEIDCPLLLMQADPDLGGILPDEYLAEIFPDKPNFTLVKIEGAGHNISKEHADLSLPIVLPWLASLQA
ncbi:alpha/beta hydrolase [Dehalococcoides mccartyi]|nr:alpha/beta hydrolase [Dehalococcoides mccartyi]